MATLPTLNPNAAVVSTTNQWAVGSYLDIDEAIASADGNAVGDDSNVTVTETGRYALANMPTDFGSMDTVSANVRYRVLGSQTNQRTLSVQIVTDEATPTALTNKVTVATNPTNTTFTNSGALTLTIQGTPTKTQWDNAVVALELVITKVKGGDTNGIRVDAVDITGTYSTAAVDVAGTATSITLTSGTGPIVPTTDVAGTTTAIAATSGTGPVVPTTEVAGTATAITLTSGTADVSSTVDVAGTSTTITITSGTGPVVPTTSVDGTSTAITLTSGTGPVVPTTEVAGTSTAIAMTSGTADVTTSVDVAGTPTSVTLTSGIGPIVPTTVVAGATTSIVSSSGTGPVVPTTQVAGTPTSVTLTSSTADIGTSPDVAGTATSITLTSGTGPIVPTTDVAGTPTSIALASGAPGEQPPPIVSQYPLITRRPTASAINRDDDEVLIVFVSAR